MSPHRQLKVHDDFAHSDFSAPLRQHIEQSLYSYGQLSQLSGVPKRTIVNWLDGTVKFPRNWQSVVRVAAALRLSREATDELLVAAALPTLQEVAATVDEPSDQELLHHWQFDEPNVNSKTHSELIQYLHDLVDELARLPAYFPQQTSFTFMAIYQDLRLRRLEYGVSLESAVGEAGNDGESWGMLRQKLSRAVILGQPGMGKTWLLKAEAIRLVHESLAAHGEGNQLVVPLLIRLPDLMVHLAGKSGLDAIRQALAELAARLTPAVPEAKLVAALFKFMEQHPQQVVLMLDALDEVPARDGLRNLARRVVMQLGASPHTRMFLTSRTLGYITAPLARYIGADVGEYEVLPFTDREIARVMRAWFHERVELLQQLHLVMRRAPAVVRQASSPLLLSLICLLNETRGPEFVGNRSSLYEPVLRLLLEGRWRSFELQLPETRVHRKLRLLEIIAWRYATYRQVWWEQLPGDVLEQAIETLPDTGRLWATWEKQWGATYEGPLWELSEWDGILVKGFIPIDGAASAVPYAFLHRTFQEFLVARYLLRRYVDEGLNAPEIQQFFNSKAADPEWHVVLLLLIEQITVQPLPDSRPLLDRLYNILLDAVQDQTGLMALAAAEILLNLRITETDGEIVETLRNRLLGMLINEQVPAVIRVHAAQAVAEMGDTRREVMDVDAIAFMPVPAGSFVMGSDPAIDPDAFPEELPSFLQGVDDYSISRFPISNAQYAVFFHDPEDGYNNPVYWPEAIALTHWQDGVVWRTRPKYRPNGTTEWEASWMREPSHFGWPADLPNAPVIGINWYEAKAFTRWLEKRWRQLGLISANTRLDLPSEAQWEKAARGDDGRIYPWGNTFDGNRLHWIGHMLMSPAAIGVFPNSASPYGVEEMVGNLWEWTRSVYRPYGEEFTGKLDFSNAVSLENRLTVRGGGYFSIRSRCRCASRSAFLPYGGPNTTFRIVKYDG